MPIPAGHALRSGCVPMLGIVSPLGAGATAIASVQRFVASLLLGRSTMLVAWVEPDGA